MMRAVSVGNSRIVESQTGDGWPDVGCMLERRKPCLGNQKWSFLYFLLKDILRFSRRYHTGDEAHQ
jgi:hypothetical protein